MRVCGGNMETPNIINGLLMTSIHEKANAMLVGGNHEWLQKKTISLLLTVFLHITKWEQYK